MKMWQQSLRCIILVSALTPKILTIATSLPPETSEPVIDCSDDAYVKGGTNTFPCVYHVGGCFKNDDPDGPEYTCQSSHGKECDMLEGCDGSDDTAPGCACVAYTNRHLRGLLYGSPQIGQSQKGWCDCEPPGI